MIYRILLTLLLGTSLNLALPPHSQARISNQGQQQTLRVSSADQAASLAASRYPGKVLRVSRTQLGNNPGYRVKLISNDGKVFTVSVDARTARVWRD